VGKFPMEFFKGTPLRTAGSVSIKYIKHILSFHDGRFEQNQDLVFQLFDQLQRHGLTRQVKAKVTTDSKQRKQIEQYLADPQFPLKLKNAIADPKAKESKILFRELNSFVMVVTASMPFSKAARNGAISKMYANHFFFGPANFFVTWSPDDVHHADSITRAKAKGMKQDIGTLMHIFLDAVLRKEYTEQDLKKIAAFPSH
jgi:hypothetical protein